MEHPAHTEYCSGLRIKKMPDTRIRCFIAISLPDQVKQGLKSAQADLKRWKIHAAWPSPAGFHFTLAFLGDTPIVEIENIKKLMKETALENPGFELVVDRLGVFPGIKKARIIWAGLNRDSEPLQDLYQKLSTKLETAGFFSAKQRFSPHTTLARIKKRVHADTLKKIIKSGVAIEPVKFQVESIELYQSKLIRSGAVHTRLYSAVLAKE